MSKQNLADDPYERLANAIVLQAVSEYRTALKTLKRNPKSSVAKQNKEELEAFFFSPRFELFTSIDAQYLVSRLQEEVSA